MRARNMVSQAICLPASGFAPWLKTAVTSKNISSDAWRCIPASFWLTASYTGPEDWMSLRTALME